MRLIPIRRDVLFAANTAEVILAVLSAVLGMHTGAIVALAIYLGRTREKTTRLEEWARLEEKRRNGKSE